MKEYPNKEDLMNRPRIFLSYKGVNTKLMEHVRDILFDLGIFPRWDREFIAEDADGEAYLNRIPEVMRDETDAVLCLVTKEMNEAPRQCKRELDQANLLNKPMYCIRYGTEDIDQGLMYPAMTADWIWIMDPADAEKEKRTLRAIAQAAINGEFRLKQTDTHAVLLDQADDYIGYFRAAAKPSLPKPFFKEILPYISSPLCSTPVPLTDYYRTMSAEGSLILTGEGGGGKSTSVKYLTYDLQDTSYIPVYIPVRELNAKSYEGPFPILRYIGNKILNLPPQTVDIPKFMKDFFRKLSPMFSFLFLIDGYNESSAYDAIQEDISFLHALPSVRMCITSRNNSGFEQRPGFTKLEAMPLSDGQIRELNKAHPVRILTDLNDRIFDLMRSPLILMMMINAYDRTDYENRTRYDLSDMNLAELISFCIQAQMSGEVYRRDYAVHVGIRVLLPLAAAQLYFSHSLEDSRIDRYELSCALKTVSKDLLIPLEERIYDLLDMNYDVRQKEEARQYIGEWTDQLENHTVSFSRSQANHTLQFLIDEMNFLEELSEDGEVRWTHQSLLDWFIARGIALTARISKMKRSPAAPQAAEYCEKWLNKTAAPITESCDDPDYDDCVEIGEFVYGMLKDTFSSREYRDLLLRVSNANGLHKSTGTCRVTLSALKQAEQIYEDSTPEKDPFGYRKLNGTIASAAYGLCHLKGGVPDGRSELEIVRLAMNTFEKCTAALKGYPAGTEKERRFIRMEHARFGTLTGAGLQKISQLSPDPEERKKAAQEAFDIALTILDERKKIRDEILADPDPDIEELKEIQKRVPKSAAAAATNYFRKGQYEKAIEYHEYALSLRRQILEDPRLQTIHSEVKAEMNENRMRILGAKVRMRIPAEADIMDYCGEFRDLVRSARDGNFYKELENGVANFRAMIVQLYRIPELSASCIQEIRDTAGYLSECANSRRPIAIDLTHELPWHSLRTAPASLSKEEQTAFLKRSIRQYLDSNAFRELLELFSCPYVMTGDLYADLKAVNEFSERWNYRNGRERQEIQADDEIAGTHRDEILKIADELGMMRQDIYPVTNADHILVLGGANRSNETRCILGKDIAERLPDAKIKIIALGASRPVTDAEKEKIRDFAPDAVTEYDAICAGMEKVFELKNGFTETIDENGGIQRHWKDSTDKRDYYALCTPSVNGRRANTKDTFAHFLQLFHVKEKAEVVLATTALYCNYQLFSLVPQALENKIHLTIAGRPVLPSTSLHAENFLQEIKATINAMYAWLSSETDS
ncbi:MAG: hypothetical protein IKG46_12730 [Solobacterium sp.]|nr:hypothetical protein [Solobacterium sp.]